MRFSALFLEVKLLSLPAAVGKIITTPMYSAEAPLQKQYFPLKYPISFNLTEWEHRW